MNPNAPWKCVQPLQLKSGRCVPCGTMNWVTKTYCRNTACGMPKPRPEAIPPWHKEKGKGKGKGSGGDSTMKTGLNTMRQSLQQAGLLVIDPNTRKGKETLQKTAAASATDQAHKAAKPAAEAAATSATENGLVQDDQDGFRTVRPKGK